jgi:hypothetical protein
MREDGSYLKHFLKLFVVIIRHVLATHVLLHSAPSRRNFHCKQAHVQRQRKWRGIGRQLGRVLATVEV